MAKAKRRQTMEVDDRALKALTEQLDAIPEKFRGQAIIRGLKASMQPTLRAARSIGPTLVNSPTIKRSFQVVTGKHVKKTRPYVVLQHRDKHFNTTRRNEGYSAKHITNWSKIGHLSALGTKAGIRTAGKSVRKKTVGKEKLKVFDASGKQETRNVKTKGRNFVVSSGGKVFPVKQVRHPGNRATRVFDKAARQAGKASLDDFIKAAEEKVKKIQDKLK